MLVFVLAALAIGSAVFCLLVVGAARRYRAVPKRLLTTCEPISVLKPLAGADPGLESNLRAVFTQDYPSFEILFALRDGSDPAAAIVEKLRREFPAVDSQLIVTGEAPYANAKVFSLDHMTRAARYSLLVTSDSDIRIAPGFLRGVAAEFQDAKLGITTCPYRAVPGPSQWSRLEAIMMNTEFLSGILVARMLEGMRFAVGPTIAARRAAIERIGGWERLKDYLAEDFMLGQLAARAGIGVSLSSNIVEHHIGPPGQEETFRQNAEHRLRWCRSTRRSRPAGYLGEIFTNPTPLALGLAMAAFPAGLPLAAAVMAMRAWAARAVASHILHDPLCRRYWYLVPVADLTSFAFWITGFFGNSIRWRGRSYYLHRDGRFERTA